jgi:hypothetical protein
MKFKALVKSFERSSSPQCPPNNGSTGFLRGYALHLDHHLGGDSASNSIFGSTSDGSWGSAPVGAVGPGPLLGCVVRKALGGVAEVLLGLLLRASLLLGSISLAGSPPLATCLSAVAP